MRKWIAFLIIAGIFGCFSSGCSFAFSKEGIVRCPKCGSTLAIDDMTLREMRK